MALSLAKDSGLVLSGRIGKHIDELAQALIVNTEGKTSCHLVSMALAVESRDGCAPAANASVRATHNQESSDLWAICCTMRREYLHPD